MLNDVLRTGEDLLLVDAGADVSALKLLESVAPFPLIKSLWRSPTVTAFKHRLARARSACTIRSQVG
jgi:hypothetical protein